MLATKSWRRGCALAIAALLLVIPASAQVPVDPNEDTESELTEEPSDLADLDRDLDESDSEESDFDLEEPDSADLDEALRSDIYKQTSDIEEILVTGEK